MGAGSSAQLPHAQADPSSPQFAVYRRIADKLETEVGKFGTRDLDADQGKDVRITSARLRRKSVQGRYHRLRRIFTSRGAAIAAAAAAAAAARVLCPSLSSC